MGDKPEKSEKTVFEITQNDIDNLRELEGWAKVEGYQRTYLRTLLPSLIKVRTYTESILKEVLVGVRKMTPEEVEQLQQPDVEPM